MTPMLEPFMYEAAMQHQSELREGAPRVAAAGVHSPALVLARRAPDGRAGVTMM
jgi:hypothetical protein